MMAAVQGRRPLPSFHAFNAFDLWAGEDAQSRQVRHGPRLSPSCSISARPRAAERAADGREDAGSPSADFCRQRWLPPQVPETSGEAAPPEARGTSPPDRASRRAAADEIRTLTDPRSKAPAQQGGPQLCIAAAGKARAKAAWVDRRP